MGPTMYLLADAPYKHTHTHTQMVCGWGYWPTMYPLADGPYTQKNVLPTRCAAITPSFKGHDLPAQARSAVQQKNTRKREGGYEIEQNGRTKKKLKL